MFLKKKQVQDFFRKSWATLKKIFGSTIASCSYEAIWLTALAFFPLIINISLDALDKNDIGGAIQSKVIPFELFSYSLGFLAPSLYIGVKANKSGYPLPFYSGFFLITFAIYTLSLIIYIIGKNKWLENVNTKNHNVDSFFTTALIFLCISFLLRIYSIYHGRRSSNFFKNQQEQQSNFNNVFTNNIGK